MWDSDININTNIAKNILATQNLECEIAEHARANIYWQAMNQVFQMRT